MNLKQLRQFLTLAETLHFGQAAKLLHMTQPPLSISIKKLEEELGGQLFIRTNQGTELTNFWRSLLKPAMHAVQAFEEVSKTSALISKGQAGTLTISYPNGAAHRFFPDFLPKFIRAYPKIDLKLLEATSAESLQLLEERKVDIGIIYYPISSEREYLKIPSERDELVAIFPLTHPLAKEKSISLKDIANEPFVSFVRTEVPTLQNVILTACQQAGFNPKSAHYAQRVETIISLVRSGVGVSLVPSICAQTYAHVIAMCPINDFKECLQIGLAVATPTHGTSQKAINFLASAGVVGSQKGGSNQLCNVGQ